MKRLFALVLIISSFVGTPQASALVGGLPALLIGEALQGLGRAVEEKVFAQRLGIQFVFCEFQNNKKGQIVKESFPGLFPCLVGHVMQQIFSSAAPMPVIAHVRFLRAGENSRMYPVEVTWKTIQAPPVLPMDIYFKGVTYLVRMEDALRRWKDTDLTLAFSRPVPIELILPKGSAPEVLYTSAADSQSGKISQVSVKLKTFREGENVRSGGCSPLETITGDRDRLCGEIYVYEEGRPTPALAGVVETDWNVKTVLYQKLNSPILRFFAKLRDFHVEAILPFLIVWPDSDSLNKYLKKVQFQFELNPNDRIIKGGIPNENS